MNTGHYILTAAGEPEEVIVWRGGWMDEKALLRWAMWMEKTENRITKRTEVGTLRVSTMFLGLDHAYGETSKPILWETMVFNDGTPKVLEFADGSTHRFMPDVGEHARRHTSQADALEYHGMVVRQLELEWGRVLP